MNCPRCKKPTKNDEFKFIVTDIDEEDGELYGLHVCFDCYNSIREDQEDELYAKTCQMESYNYYYE